MAALINLPAYRAPNALNFSPINDAIDSYTENKRQNALMDLKREQMGMERERLNMQKASHATSQAAAARAADMQEAKMAAGQVQAVMGLPEGQREQAWQQLLTRPGFRDLPPHMRDLRTAGPMILSKAAEYRPQHEIDEHQTNMALKQAQTQNALSEAKLRGQKSSTDEAIGGLIRGMMPGQVPQEGVQPQSFNGQAPNALMRPMADTGGPDDPNLVLAQAAQPQQADPNQELIDTPLGRMTRQRAQQLGMALALGGKGDAGKLLSESANQGRLGKEAANEVDKKQINRTELYARLQGIKQSFRPEFQSLEGKLGMKWAGLLDYATSGKAITPEQKAQLSDFAVYRQDAFENINNYIKEITGAAMTDSEAKRILKGMPNPGEGIFDGDGPTEFKAKLDNAIRQSELAVARYNAFREKGLTIPLSRMPGIIQERTDEILKQMKSANPGASTQELAPLVRSRLKREFGI